MRRGGPRTAAAARLAPLAPLARAQMIEIATFLSPYLLSCQGDRVAMGHGVEVRYPFLDPDVVDFCTRLPRRIRAPRACSTRSCLRKMAFAVTCRRTSGSARRNRTGPL